MMDITVPTATKGYYTWNDTDNRLEFMSEAASDARENRVVANRKTTLGRGTIAQSKNGSSTFSLMISRTLIAGLPSSRGGVTGDTQKVSLGMPNESNEIVTLSNVKEVAMDRVIEEMEIQSNSVSSSFRKLNNTNEFDEFLLSLLHYFACFFDQLEQELRPHKSSFLQPSKAELKALADTRRKMEATRQKLAQSYCKLILGLGIEAQHHMGCGKKRVSMTHRDKKMFEDVYLFCTFVVWITFRRKELERVKIEIGNMLRSEVFNPSLKQKVKALITAETKQVSAKRSQHQKRSESKHPGQRPHELLLVELPKLEVLTPAQHRRMKGKGSSIGTSINQRSTVLVSLLPLPKEESSYLFQPSTGNQGKTRANKKNLDDLKIDYTSQKIGIIGEPRDYFNMSDLTPKSMENVEDEESTEDGDGDYNRKSGMGRKLSAQADTISRVTTAEKM